MTQWFRTLHGRLTLGYAVAFFCGLIVFAVVSFVALDAGLKRIVDVRLESTQLAVVRLVTADPDISPATRERLDLAMGPNISGAFFTGSGRTLFSSAESIAATRSLILNASSQPHVVTVSVSGSAGRMLTHRVVAADGRIVFFGLWRQLDVAHDFERFSMLVFGVAVVVIGGIAVFIGAMVARQGLTPLRAVAQTVSEIEANDLSRRVGIKNDPSELGRLCMTFDRMLARLESAFERQRRFTADASHELRAPLTVIRSAADLALRREREPAAYQRVLVSIVEAAQRLEFLTDDLLAMARADSAEIELEPVDVGCAIDEAVSAMQPLAGGRSVTLTSDCEMSCFVQANGAALVRVLIAIVDNAIKMSPAGGAVAISAGAGSPGHVLLQVRDEGPGFSSRALEHGTERFWRDDAVRIPGTGSGLGLAICNTIVRACRGDLRLANVPGGGALVTITLPVCSPALSTFARAGSVI